MRLTSEACVVGNNLDALKELVDKRECDLHAIAQHALLRVKGWEAMKQYVDCCCLEERLRHFTGDPITKPLGPHPKI